jgi:hypothetical protein
MSISTSFSREAAKRRSRRLRLMMRVAIAPADPTADPHGFEATVTNLNRNGATLAADRKIAVASLIAVTNSQGESMVARVVSELGQRKSLRQYGIEFVDNSAGSHFWGVHFP